MLSHDEIEKMKAANAREMHPLIANIAPIAGILLALIILSICYVAWVWEP